MKRFFSKIKQLVRSEDGPTAVEYAVMLAVIIIVCLAAIQAVGDKANSTFENINNQLQSANSGATGLTP